MPEEAQANAIAMIFVKLSPLQTFYSTFSIKIVQFYTKMDYFRYQNLHSCSCGSMVEKPHIDESFLRQHLTTNERTLWSDSVIYRHVAKCIIHNFCY